MNFRTTLLLLVLLAAVGGTLWFTRDKDDKPKVAETVEHKLVDFEANDVTRVSVTNSDDKKFVLQKTGSEWKLVEPVSAAAKTFECDDLVRALVGLQSKEQIDASKKAAGGLDHPSFTVELTTRANKTAKLQFGDKSTFGDSSYVQLNDNAKADVVASTVYAQLEKPASNYRDTKLVTTSSDQVKQLAITRDGKTIKLEQKGENWEITEPIQVPADATAVKDLIFGVTNLNAVSFVDKPAGPGKYSLAHPRMAIWFNTQPPTTQPATTQPVSAADMAGGSILRFGGNTDITKEKVFVSLNNTEVAVIPVSAEKPFERNERDLRNKDLVTIDPEKVSSVRVLVNRRATTQPTTKPADTHEYVIDRRVVAPPVLGPELPAGAVPTTQPATQPSTGAMATTQPATTQPATLASTQPTTQPAAVAVAQPPVPASKWFFSSGSEGDAEEGQIQALLDSFHPLKVTKYIEPDKSEGNLYTVVIHTIPAKAGDQPAEYAFNFIDLGTRVVGTYKDATFEIDRAIIEKIGGDFKTKKPVAAPAAPTPSIPGLPPA